MRPRRSADHSWCIVCCVLATCGVACSSSSSAGGTSDASDASDMGAGDVRDPSKNCVKPGSVGNDKGVGAYCEPGVPCVHEAGTIAICTADVPGVPDTAWFCTRPCVRDADCGSAAFCITDPAHGTGCVPASCLPADGGVDASNEAD